MALLTFDRNAGRFFEAEREVEVLHRLRRGAFEEIIERRDDDDALTARREREAADLDVMFSSDAADPWRLVDDTDERLTGVELAISRLDCVARQRTLQPEIRRQCDAAKMRR